MRTIARRLLAASLVTLLATSAANAQRGGGGSDSGRGGRGGDRGGSSQVPGAPAIPGAQFGGGGGSSGRGGMSADDSFNRLSGGADSVDLSKVPPESLDRINRFAQMTGSDPLPNSGVMSREQYRTRFNTQMEKMRSGGGMAGGGRGGMQFSMSPGGAPAAPSMGVSGMSGSVGGMGGMGGGMQVTDEMVKSRLIDRYDTDKDGRISRAEAQRTDRLKSVFDQYDTNRDGFIDASEGKVYLGAMFGGGMQGGNNTMMMGGNNSMGYGGQPSGWGNNGSDMQSMSVDPRGSNRRDRKGEEEEETIVYRYGKLPNNLPSWWEKLDTDKDGQIGLYEWRADKRNVDEFIAMDLNGDGLLTAEEWLRKQRIDTDFKPGESAGRGSRGSMGSGGLDRSTMGASSSGSSRGTTSGSSNPFTNGGRGDMSSQDRTKDDKKNNSSGNERPKKSKGEKG